jgi:hypothetical protein
VISLEDRPGRHGTLAWRANRLPRRAYPQNVGRD